MLVSFTSITEQALHVKRIKITIIMLLERCYENQIYDLDNWIYRNYTHSFNFIVLIYINMNILKLDEFPV